jgi:hypothetical protein
MLLEPGHAILEFFHQPASEMLCFRNGQP